MRLFHSAWMPLAVLAIGVASTAMAVRALSVSATQHDQQRFDRAARQLTDALAGRLGQESTLLNGSAKLLASRGEFSAPDEFVPFIDAFGPQDRPGTRAYGYARRLMTHELPNMVVEGRRRYAPDFKIHPENTSTSEHYVVLMTHPGNQSSRWWTGFNMSSDAPFRTAIDRVRNSGSLAATEPTLVSLREGRPPQPVFALLAPVSKSPTATKPASKPATNATADASRPKLCGIAFAAFRADEMLQSVFRPLDLPDVVYTVRDGAPAAAGGVQLYQSAGYSNAAAGPAFSVDVLVNVGGRTWTIAVRGTPAFADAAAAKVTRRVAIIGGSASLLAAALVWLQSRRRLAAARRATSAPSRDAPSAEHRLERVLEAMGVGIWSCELPDGQVTWDERARAMFFLPDAASLTVSQALERVHPEDRARLRDTLASSVQSGTLFDIKYRTVSPAGDKTHWLRSVGRPVQDGDHSPGNAATILFSGVTVDITAREVAWLDADTARREAEQARVQAERAGRAKDEFLATIGHELRAPLGAILGWAQLLRRQGDRLDPAVDEGLAVIERNARAQDRLVADLLDVGLVAAGAVRLEIELVDLAAAARAAVDAARPTAEAKKVDLQLALDLTAGPVRGDPDRLQQVFVNLMSNAVKFTPAGGQVRVAVSRDEDRVLLTVADTGEGIDPAFLPYVFDRFRQQDASTARRHGGLGLGLAIVRHLIELHDGRVRVDSAGLGQGATFVVELPAAFPASPTATHRWQEELSESRDVEETHSDANRMPAALRGVKVLLVDNDPDTLAAVRGVLIAAGGSVETARTAPEGLAAVLRERPDVVLCDIAMPDVDGFEFLRRLRSLSPESGGATPAAALTGFARPEDCLRALTQGFAAHIAKPVEADELVVTVLRLSQVRTSGKLV
jgi:signal transduction histidine kinase/CHASE1-domain containing sensor protein/ActR/RegA family two-component response regulator